MKKMLKYGCVAAFGLMLVGCGGAPDPVRINKTYESELKFHTENDSVIDGGVRELAPGIFVRKFLLGYETLYMRCDKDGNPISTDVTVNYRSGKSNKVVGFI